MERRPAPDPHDPPHESGRSDVIDLLVRANAGDDDARTQLLRRCVPRLAQFAAVRLPKTLAVDAEDFVQDAVSRALGAGLGREIANEHALFACLRQVVLNRIRDSLRATPRRGTVSAADDRLSDPLSPLEQVIGHQNVEQYEEALRRLTAPDREAIVSRLELQLSYAEIGEALNVATPNAARVLVRRALHRLAREMSGQGTGRRLRET